MLRAEKDKDAGGELDDKLLLNGKQAAVIAGSPAPAAPDGDAPDVVYLSVVTQVGAAASLGALDCTTSAWPTQHQPRHHAPPQDELLQVNRPVRL